MNLTWLVAVVDPDLIAEQGYSSEDTARPEATLAKAMQGRVLPSVFDAKITDPSLRAIYDVLLGREESVDVLVASLSTDDAGQDLARRTALTLVACAFLAERDDVATCLRIIDDALDLLTQTSVAADLCRALLLQQRALRNNDIGESSALDLDQVRRLVDRPQFAAYPEVVLRPNIDVSSESAVENIRETIKSAAVGFELHSPAGELGSVLSDIGDDTFVQYQRWLDSTYALKLDRTIPDLGPDVYFENLRLEILGHRDVYRSRRELAMMRIVRLAPAIPSAVASDCLRLLRLSGSDAQLGQLVGELTVAGPSSALLAEGRRIESHRVSERSLRTGEMIVLAAAAEMMPPPEAFEVLTRVLLVIRRGGPSTAPVRWQADFFKDEQAWIAAAALAGAAGTAGVIARDLLEYATADRLADMAFDSVIARIIPSIDWPDVDHELRERWQRLGSLQAHNEPISPTAAAIRHQLRPAQDVSLSDDASLNDLAEALNNYLRTQKPIPNGVWLAAKSAALSGLNVTVKEAQNNTYVPRAVKPADVAAALLTESSDHEVWTGLLDFLVNPLVARDEKTRAFDILVRERPLLPPELQPRYADRVLALLGGVDPWADSHHGSVFVEALTFAYVYGFLKENDAAENLNRLSASPYAQTRRQAGRSLSLLASASIDTWMLPKIFALSNDPEPTVRLTVARALGQICRRSDIASALAVERLSELLQSPGVHLALNTLNRLTPETVAIPAINAIVRQMHNDSQSWRIRKRAAELLG